MQTSHAYPEVLDEQCKTRSGIDCRLKRASSIIPDDLIKALRIFNAWWGLLGIPIPRGGESTEFLLLSLLGVIESEIHR